MNSEKQGRIEACIQELASLLYEESDKSQLTDLEGIEKTVRRQVLERVSPEIAIFLSKKRQEQKQVGGNAEFG
jgi:hypothetical protein